MALDGPWSPTGRSGAARCRAPCTANGSRPPTATRSRPSPPRTRAASPSWSRSATAGCSSSPFAFFRGGAAVMAADLAASPAPGLRAQLCGDAHLSNFGVFASPERRLVFDSTTSTRRCPGPFEWDVKRLAASIEVAGRERRLRTVGDAPPRPGGDGRRLPRGDARLRRRCATSTSGTRASTSRRPLDRLRSRRGRDRLSVTERNARQGARQGQRAGAARS